MFKKLHLPAVLAAATSILGIVSDPAILGLLPHKVAIIVTGAGIVWQAVTKAIAQGSTPATPVPPPSAPAGFQTFGSEGI